MEKPRTVTFRECELLKEGVGPSGAPWQKYQYYGDDGEHYVLFGKHDLNKPFTLVQETKPGKDGKTYTNWVILKEPKAGGGAGVKLIMDKLESVIAEVQQVRRGVEQLVEDMEKKRDKDLPF